MQCEKCKSRDVIVKKRKKVGALGKGSLVYILWQCEKCGHLWRTEEP